MTAFVRDPNADTYSSAAWGWARRGNTGMMRSSLAKLQPEQLVEVKLAASILFSAASDLAEENDVRVEPVSEIEGMRNTLRMIAADAIADVYRFEGQPFTGKTVSEYMGCQGAAIQALARVVERLLPSAADASTPEASALPGSAETGTPPSTLGWLAAGPMDRAVERRDSGLCRLPIETSAVGSICGMAFEHEGWCDPAQAIASTPAHPARRDPVHDRLGGSSQPS